MNILSPIPVPNISMHISNVFQDKELEGNSVVKDYLTTAADGKDYHVIYYALETAELRVKNRLGITMDFWRTNVDRMLEFNDQSILTSKGNITHAQMEAKVAVIYQEFDQTRKRVDAEQTDLKELEEVNALLKKVERK